jgi:hypothetical protein
MQPTYLPWIGYFDMIDQVDGFVFLDNVQVVKQSWGVRNRIKTVQGELMLSIPIKKDRILPERLYCNTLVNDDHPWMDKHLKSVEQAYRKAPYFEEVMADYEGLLRESDRRLGPLNANIIRTIARKTGISTPVTFASELEGLSGRKDDLLVEICRHKGADAYLSAQGSAQYIEADRPGGAFSLHGIELFYHRFEHPEYPQLYNGFVPYMCVLDLLFNCGYKDALSVIRSGRHEPYPRDEFVKQRLNEEH